MSIGLVPAVLLAVAIFALFGLLEAWRRYLDGLED